MIILNHHLNSLCSSIHVTKLFEKPLASFTKSQLFFGNVTIIWKFHNYMEISQLKVSHFVVCFWHVTIVFGNVTIKSHMFPGISSEADEVEVSLDEVDDHVPPNILLVLCRRVVSEIYWSLVAINSFFLMTYSYFIWMIVIWLPWILYHNGDPLVFHLNDRYLVAMIPNSVELLVFHLNDGLSKVLQASTLGWSPTDVNHLVRQNLQ